MTNQPSAPAAGSKLLLTGLLLLGLTALRATAQLSLGPQLSLLGIGAGASIGLGSTGLLSVSGEFGFIPAGDIALTADDIDFTISPDIGGGLIALDLHPARSGFVLSAGLYFGGYAGSGETEKLSGTVEIGDNVYPVEDVGTLVGDFSWKGPAPVLSIGRVGTGFNVRLGFALTKAPDANVSVTGRLRDDAEFQQDLDDEVEQIREDLKSVPFTPFLSLGFRFGLGKR